MIDCHEPSIDKRTFFKVQDILRQRAETVPTYPFTGKIKCSICGNSFTRKKDTHKGITYVHWICRSKKDKGMTCGSVNFSENEILKISAQVLGLNEFDGDVFLNEVRQITVEKNGDLCFYILDGSC